MTEMFQVVPIEGKGCGIVASKFIKRGTLILKEVSQMPSIDVPSPNLQMQSDSSMVDYIKKIVSVFELMNKSDKEEYLKLHNKYERDHVLQGNFRLNLKVQNLKTIIMKIDADAGKAENILKIIGIYETNSFGNGLKLKTSRFNHSCWPNAVQISNEVRATYNIKEGQEITINYLESSRLFGMKKRGTRQKLLLERMDFTCFCYFCKKQENDSNSKTEVELDSKIEGLIQEVEILEHFADLAKTVQTPLKGLQLYPPEKCRHEIGKYKELYKFGKEKKAHHSCLFDILSRGYQIAALEYQLCYFSQNHQFLEEFKKECVNFSRAAEGFGKLLGNEIVMPELWKRRQNFEKYFFEECPIPNAV